VDEFILLRQVVGWGTPNRGATGLSVKNALFSVCLESDGRIIGLGRVVGDGGLYFYIQDLIVVPEFRGNGYSLLIMKELMGYIKKNAKSGSFVGLFAAKGVEELYLKFDFVNRPSEIYGPGMFIPFDRLREIIT
jgi:predicted GNAT family N-acyltransferase